MHRRGDTDEKTREETEEKPKKRNYAYLDMCNKITDLRKQMYKDGFKMDHIKPKDYKVLDEQFLTLVKLLRRLPNVSHTIKKLKISE